MNGPPKCSRCGSELPLDAPGGHCLACLLQLGLISDAEKSDDAATEVTQDTEQNDLPTASRQLAEKPGDRIGRYKLLQQIGEGGCGIVYMAEQEEPIRRRVALKIIKLGMDTHSVIARFEAERQALALMDHPNIAKVLDAGATTTGRPYFVMELVRGVKITTYCDEQRLSTRQRLELFAKVCQAVQHAHQKGIIHRDLKPSNVLLTLQDGAPVPKIIDFGIAKATTDQRLTDKTLFTAFEQFIGTPAYMSPEQAGLGGLDIDTRSDIYSLGILLYELLTGKPPFDSETFARSAFDEILHIIREKEPPRPSARLTTLTEQELTTVAQRRQIESSKLPGLLRGDLDWIVMKALDKDRTRRYQTASGFASDIHHFLASEPVSARPPGGLYRFQKMARRNKLAFSAVAAVITVLAVGVIVSAGEAIRATRAVRESQQITQFLTDMLQGVGPAVALGRDTTILHEILDKTASRVEEELRDQPKLEANLLTLIGEVYRALTIYDQEETMHRKALAIRIKLFGERNADTATSMDLLGTALLQQTKLPEAETFLQKGLTNRLEKLGKKNAEVATSLSNLGVLRQYQSKFLEAEKLYEQALQMRRALGGSNDFAITESLICLSSALWYQHKDLLRAEAMDREALATRKKILPANHPDLLPCLINLAPVYQDENKLGDAERTMREAIDLCRHVLKTNSLEEAQVLNNLGWLLCTKGDFEESEKMLRRSLTIRREALAEKHDWVAESLNTLAVVLQRAGKLDEAEELQRHQLDLVIELHGTNHLRVINSKNNLGWLLYSRHKLSEAEQLTLEALAVQRKIIGPTNRDTAQMLQNLGVIYVEEGKVGDAERANREALEHFRAAYGNDEAKTAGSQMLLARFLCNHGSPADAEPFALQAVEILKQKQPDDWGTFNAQAILGRCLAELKNYPSAETNLLVGCLGMEHRLSTIPADKRMYFKEGIQSLAKLYEATGQQTIAEKWKKKLAALDKPAN
jgi:serine/threonine protein kinase/tetratricopeptide (TPR) repeat protein